MKWWLPVLPLSCALLFFCSDDQPPVVLSTSIIGDTADQVGPYDINAVVVDDRGVAKVSLFYTLDYGFTVKTIAMVKSGEGRYHAAIPGQPEGTQVGYFIQALDGSGNRACDPPLSCGDQVPPEAMFLFQVLSASASWCSADGDCAAGEYCRRDTGVCLEYTGRCVSEGDCPQAMVCDVQSSLCLPEVTPCLVDGDCRVGEECFIETMTCRPGTSCRTDEDCGVGEVCQEATASCGPGCGGDGDCEPGEDCVEGRCLPWEADCFTSNDCPEGLICYPGTWSCQAPPARCVSHDDCPAGELCDGVAGRCVQCLDDRDCPFGARCDVASGLCVALDCMVDGDCGPLMVCEAGRCAPGEVECLADGDCASGLVCDEEGGVCVQCLEDGDCEPLWACVQGACWEVGCTDDGDCDQGLVCHLGEGHCVACTRDDHCGEGAICTEAYLCEPVEARGLCEPCETDVSCGGAGDLCVFDSLIGQSRCGKACSGLEDCPFMFWCDQSLEPGQCRVEFGSCDEPWECLSDEHCDEGESCDVGLCVAEQGAGDLCDPCVGDSDCGGPGDLCLFLGDGFFCSRDCLTLTCPDGFDCISLDVEILQCVPRENRCPVIP